jgi:hypothetical protein
VFAAIQEVLAQGKNRSRAAKHVASGADVSPGQAPVTRASKEERPDRPRSSPCKRSSELIGGFWIWELKSRDEAIQWLKRAPFQDGEVEIRQLIEAEDFRWRSSEARAGESSRGTGVASPPVT